MVFKYKNVFTLPMTQCNSSIFKGNFPKAKYLIQVHFSYNFTFFLTKLTLLFKSKLSKWLNKYFKRCFLENQEMKCTELQEKVGGFPDIKIKGENCLTQLFTKWPTGFYCNHKKPVICYKKSLKYTASCIYKMVKICICI